MRAGQWDIGPVLARWVALYDLVTGRLDADDLYVGVVGCSLQEIR